MEQNIIKVGESIIEQRVKDRKSTKTFIIILALLFLFLCAFSGMRILGYYLIYVDGSSMNDTLLDGDKLIANSFEDPQYGDIIIISGLWDDDLIKRLIGKPGDNIVIQNYKVYRNGIELNEPYAKGITRSSSWENRTLGEDEYFFLGDNRENSTDSRILNKCCNRSQIIGIVKEWCVSIKDLTNILFFYVQKGNVK